ncbi:MAG: YeeE/YedE family protein, partial [Flavobacteriaceae bacterium]|nr:YeeE/YedE family protein [Flavobacteriaceae bacterium]
PRYMFGGIIFGIGWALAGACPGPMFTLIGAGYVSFLVVIVAAILGTFLYGMLRDKLPH